MDHSKYINHKELAKKLQSEIDGILTNVADDKKLYAEFREHEIFDIQNGDAHEIVRHTLDERIMLGRTSSRAAAMDRIERTSTSAVNKITAAGRLFHYLFKPLEY